jgi:hypothetical protein
VTVRRRVWVPLVAIVLAALVVVALYARAMVPSFARPSNLARPELVSVIEAAERSGAVLQLSFDGHELELDTSRSTHLFGPALNERLLVWYGESEEGPWYATARSTADEDPACFRIGSSPFYAPGEPPFYGDEGEIVVVGDRELGVVLPKASKFDAAGSRPDLETGVYQLGYREACANERGEITRFRP